MQMEFKKEINGPLRESFNALLGYATFLNRNLKVKPFPVLDENK